ncbi:retrovirus-related pol polyprotein line-1 [Plakobranchus ocellatus]|uniref:Retrovirus-related pol polyprotein line-1 n=1 Tax=Plakobranchus ocellatus TaxID=259542 RepID=A0AAV3YU39_9GAST|nr:retrovirus-related pol polyprotein line-1 [Plakobranchus ocellatus]
MEGPAILKEEVEHAISKMKQGKATGADGIPVEAIKVLDDLDIIEKINLMNTMYNNGEIPQDMKKSLYIIMPAKSRNN